MVAVFECLLYVENVGFMVMTIVGKKSSVKNVGCKLNKVFCIL